jgi:hypothetical protein
MAPNGMFLPILGENLKKINKLMLAGNATKIPKFSKKNLLVETEFF